MGGGAFFPNRKKLRFVIIAITWDRCLWLTENHRVRTRKKKKKHKSAGKAAEKEMKE